MRFGCCFIILDAAARSTDQRKKVFLRLCEYSSILCFGLEIANNKKYICIGDYYGLRTHRSFFALAYKRFELSIANKKKMDTLNGN